MDNAQTLDYKIAKAQTAQAALAAFPREKRAEILKRYSTALKEKREALAAIIHQESGKTLKESLGEVDGAADILLKTVADATLADVGNMTRTKERPPVGVVGLITSFNFPIAVAHWTIAPALLAGNAVVWKPSEKTPSVAFACKEIFDMCGLPGALHILGGDRAIGEALVAHEGVDMISATGSVAMGQGIKKTLAQKKNNTVPPILELGGNNGVVVSDKQTATQLEWSVEAVLSSFLASTGQRCTNTRRLIVHKNIYQKTIDLFKTKIEKFLSQPIAPDNAFGYSRLIDEDALMRFEQAKKEAVNEGGEIIFGKNLLNNRIEPALALMPKQTAIMHKETFAPILFITPYENFSEALAMLNAPANAGLVSGIYTQNTAEAEQFARENGAGHILINSPKGTSTPAYGMGFGGNKDSGEGEILNSADPLFPFTRRGKFSRIAQNKDVKMSS